MAVAEWTGALLDWKASLEALQERLAPAFCRSETRQSAFAFIEGLLSPAERKTGWMLAEQAGLARPYRIQSLLGRSRWSADLLRDLVRSYVAEALGDRDGVLVVDDTGFLKKGAIQSALVANTPVRPGASRTARLACSCPTPAASAMP